MDRLLLKGARIKFIVTPEIVFVKNCEEIYQIKAFWIFTLPYVYCLHCAMRAAMLRLRLNTVFILLNAQGV